ncbi:probable glycosyltransferase 7 [Panicum virgatum]|uniref:probable glycosyltransferase 7 n=1 Tax=Panicum virgatum TaxID=38727 RepID=UPI0019D5FA5D|nr:probable glycosyltransferase 7 [Panicum virgatum]
MEEMARASLVRKWEARGEPWRGGEHGGRGGGKPCLRRRKERPRTTARKALLEPSMAAYWAKIPVVRAAMLAHPEADWVWWVNADAFFTDMDFSLSLPRLF